MAKKNSNKIAAMSATAKKAKGSFEPTKVNETIQISPKNLVFREQKLRGRVQPVQDEELIALAESLRTRQDQPIQVRVTKQTGMYELIFGNTRGLAGLKIVEGFKGLNGKTEYAAMPDFTLRAEVVECDDEEAFLRTITENVQRIQTSDIDDAVNHELLRNEFGMSDAAITRLYGYAHQASVTGLKKLLLLPSNLQQKIHVKDMTKQAGFVLVEYCKKVGKIDASGLCNQEVCDAIMAHAKGTEDIGNVGSNAITAAIKAYEKETPPVTPAPVNGQPDSTPVVSPTGEPVSIEMDGEHTSTTVAPPAPPAQPRAVFALTLKELKDTFSEFAGLEGGSSKVAEFCGTMLSYIAGTVEKDALYQYLESVLGN